MTRTGHRTLPLLLLCCAALACAAMGHASLPATAQPGQAFVVRPFTPELGGRWIGNGIAYGPHRDGQRPGGPSPTRAQLREDLQLLVRSWSLIRTYDASPTTEALLGLIRSEGFPLKVMLGCSLEPEQKAAAAGTPVPLPEARAANRAQVEASIRLANAYPEVVLAVIAGNETQISWSDHRVAPDVLIGWIREVRARTRAPVTTADDFGFWVSEESLPVAREVDFIDVHAYAMWAGQQREQALSFTQEKLAAVARRHPGRTLLLGELGWATRRHSEGEQAKLIKGAPGEEQQAAFYREALAWTTREHIANLWFEAFDENWKGGAHPDEVEKHWGLFRADRTPKRAMQDGSTH